MTKPGQVRISFYGQLRRAAGQRSVNIPIPGQLSGRSLIGETIKLIPGLEPELINDECDLYVHLNVLVNGRVIKFLDWNLDYLLGDGDQVSRFPALSGGTKRYNITGLIEPRINIWVFMMHIAPDILRKGRLKNEVFFPQKEEQPVPGTSNSAG